MKPTKLTAVRQRITLALTETTADSRPTPKGNDLAVRIVKAFPAGLVEPAADLALKLDYEQRRLDRDDADPSTRYWEGRFGSEAKDVLFDLARADGPTRVFARISRNAIPRTLGYSIVSTSDETAERKSVTTRFEFPNAEALTVRGATIFGSNGARFVGISGSSVPLPGQLLDGLVTNGSIILRRRAPFSAAEHLSMAPMFWLAASRDLVEAFREFTKSVKEKDPRDNPPISAHLYQMFVNNSALAMQEALGQQNEFTEPATVAQNVTRFITGLFSLPLGATAPPHRKPRPLRPGEPELWTNQFLDRLVEAERMIETGQLLPTSQTTSIGLS